MIVCSTWDIINFHGLYLPFWCDHKNMYIDKNIVRCECYKFVQFEKIFWNIHIFFRVHPTCFVSNYIYPHTCQVGSKHGIYTSDIVCGVRSVQQQFVAHHILVFTVYGVFHNSSQPTFQFLLFQILLNIDSKLFPYFLNNYYSRFYFYQSHIGHTFAFSRVALEVNLSPFQGLDDPLLFSAVCYAVTIFLWSQYGEYAGYTFWVDPVIQSSQYTPFS